jgi:hypothetical protein
VGRGRVLIQEDLVIFPNLETEHIRRVNSGHPLALPVVSKTGEARGFWAHPIGQERDEALFRHFHIR